MVDGYQKPLEKRIKKKYQVEILWTLITNHTSHRTTRGYGYYRYATNEMGETSRNGCEIFRRISLMEAKMKEIRPRVMVAKNIRTTTSERAKEI